MKFANYHATVAMQSMQSNKDLIMKKAETGKIFWGP